MHFFASSNLQIISSRWVSLLCLNTSVLIFSALSLDKTHALKNFSHLLLFLMWFFNWIFSHYYYQTWTKSSTESVSVSMAHARTHTYACAVESVCANSLIIRKGSASNLSYKSSFYPTICSLRLFNTPPWIYLSTAFTLRACFVGLISKIHIIIRIPYGAHLLCFNLCSTTGLVIWFD